MLQCPVIETESLMVSCEQILKTEFPDSEDRAFWASLNDENEVRAARDVLVSEDMKYQQAVCELGLDEVERSKNL